MATSTDTPCTDVSTLHVGRSESEGSGVRQNGAQGESGFMPARRRYAGYLDDADGAKIGDGRVQVA